jgi:uncharacterized protein YbaP (TraB family)
MTTDVRQTDLSRRARRSALRPTPPRLVPPWFRRPFRLAAAVALAVGVCLATEAARPAAQTQAARSFLWKASARQGTVYLVGSVHLLSQDYYPLSPALEAAFKESHLLVEEVDYAQMMEPEAQRMLLTRGMLPVGQSLGSVLSPATLAIVTERVAALGLPLAPLQRFKPWSLSLMLLGMEWQKAGFDASLGLDKHFYDRAASEGKPVEGLETVEFQISRFDGMSMDVQDRLLAGSLKELETQTASLRVLADAWKSGDAATVERIVLQDLRAEPILYERLLVERNRAWLPRIDALFDRDRPSFVVVGAAHLVGPDGLLAMLRARGCTIEQL